MASRGWQTTAGRVGIDFPLGTTNPSAPATGNTLYTDKDDGLAKIIDSSGNITTLSGIDQGSSGGSNPGPTVPTIPLGQAKKQAATLQSQKFPWAIAWSGNDFFDEASIDTGGTRFSGANAWTALNIGASTVTISGEQMWLTSPASASLQMRGYYENVPTGNWCVRIALGLRPGSTDTSEKSVGMFLRDSTTSKIESWGIGFSGGNPILWANKWTNATTHSAVRVTTTLTGLVFPGFLEIEYDGTNYTYRFGQVEWGMYQYSSSYQFAKTNFLGAAADGIGFFSENDQSVPTTLITPGIYRVATSNVI